MSLSTYPKISVRKTPTKGRGVFAEIDILANETIEICPVLTLSKSDRASIDKTMLYNYYFAWGENRETAGIALGFGSLYNHSYEPNAHYIKNFDRDELTFVALRDIKKGAEITTNYNGDPSSQKLLWFAPVY